MILVYIYLMRYRQTMSGKLCQNLFSTVYPEASNNAGCSGLRSKWVISAQTWHWIAFARNALSWDYMIWSKNSVLGMEKYNIGLADNIKLIKFLYLYSDCHCVSCQTKIIIENLQLTYFQYCKTYVRMALSTFLPDSDYYQPDRHPATCNMKELMIHCQNPTE